MTDYENRLRQLRKEAGLPPGEAQMGLEWRDNEWMTGLVRDLKHPRHKEENGGSS